MMFVALSSVLTNQYEVRSKFARALVQKLVVGMLSIGTTAASQHLHGAVVDGVAINIHRLTVAFHFQLLQVVR